MADPRGTMDAFIDAVQALDVSIAACGARRIMAAADSVPGTPGEDTVAEQEEKSNTPRRALLLADLDAAMYSPTPLADSPHAQLQPGTAAAATPSCAPSSPAAGAAARSASAHEARQVATSLGGLAGGGKSARPRTATAATRSPGRQPPATSATLLEAAAVRGRRPATSASIRVAPRSPPWSRPASARAPPRAPAGVLLTELPGGEGTGLMLPVHTPLPPQQAALQPRPPQRDSSGALHARCAARCAVHAATLAAASLRSADVTARTAATAPTAAAPALPSHTARRLRLRELAGLPGRVSPVVPPAQQRPHTARFPAAPEFEHAREPRPPASARGRAPPCGDAASTSEAGSVTRARAAARAHVRARAAREVGVVLRFAPPPAIPSAPAAAPEAPPRSSPRPSPRRAPVGLSLRHAWPALEAAQRGEPATAGEAQSARVGPEQAAACCPAPPRSARERASRAPADCALPRGSSSPRAARDQRARQQKQLVASSAAPSSAGPSSPPHAAALRTSPYWPALWVPLAHPPRVRRCADRACAGTLRLTTPGSCSASCSTRAGWIKA